MFSTETQPSEVFDFDDLLWPDHQHRCARWFWFMFYEKAAELIPPIIPLGGQFSG
jgi:hypothetical protein